MHVSFAPSTPMCLPPHAPQVEGVTTAPAFASVVTMPASHASRYTFCEAGVTMKRTRGATRLPRTTSAASARSSSVPFAHEPTKAWSIGVPAAAATGCEFSITLSGNATSGCELAEIDLAHRAVVRIRIGIEASNSAFVRARIHSDHDLVRLEGRELRGQLGRHRRQRLARADARVGERGPAVLDVRVGVIAVLAGDLQKRVLRRHAARRACLPARSVSSRRR